MRSWPLKARRLASSTLSHTSVALPPADDVSFTCLAYQELQQFQGAA